MRHRRVTANEIDPVIAVPARNEQRRLPSLLEGLASQTWIAESGRRLRVVLVLNNCTDKSHESVTAAAVLHPGLDVVPVSVIFDHAEAHVGSARRLAMENAYRRCAAPERSVLLTTDADAVPSDTWVSANLRHLADGIDLVGGLVVGDEVEEDRLGPDFRQRARLHQRYGRAIDRLASLIDPLRHDPWPRHHDHTGASIAVWADVHHAVGGMPALPFREDVGFVDRVRAAGYYVRHPMDVVVKVSARLAGRAPGGMADCLKEWMRDAANGVPLLVEDPACVLERLHKRRCLRTLGVDPDVGALANALRPNKPDMPATMNVESALSIVNALIDQVERDTRAA